MPDFKTTPAFTSINSPGCTIMVNVPPGNGPKIRKNMEAFFKAPEVIEAIEGVGTIHYARWILYDNDTKFLYTVLFDGDFDKYWADFLPYFVKYPHIPPVFVFTEGWPKDALTNLEAFRQFFRDHQVNSLGEWTAFGGETRNETRKALKVNKAFQKVLDNPAAQKALQDPALRPLLDLASD